MGKIERLVIATGNPGKLGRYQKTFEGLVRNLEGLKESDLAEKPVEIGQTAEENAKIKALFYANRLGVLVFSEDESLFVDFLPHDKQPGVHVRRINGKDDATDSELLKYWAELVSQVPENKRTGRWHVAYCLATPHGVYRTASHDRPVKFYYPPSIIGIPGWPLSSIQGSPGFGKPSSEYSEIERRISQNETNELIKVTLRKLTNALKRSGKAVIYMK